MYFMDFLTGSVTTECRYFLSGDNHFLKNFAIDRLANFTGRKISRVSSVKDMTPEGLFGEKRLYVLGSKSNPKKFQDNTVKISNNKMGKAYKDAGFVEVVCSTLFPSQAGQFASFLMGAEGLKKGPARTISKICNYDPAVISNTVQALSYLDHELSTDELVGITQGLYTPDTYKIIDEFVEGNYQAFVNHLSRTNNNIHEILWSMLGALLRLQKSYQESAFAKTWYQKKMASAGERISRFGFEIIIPYVNSLCGSYGQSRPILLMRLKRLIFYLDGRIAVL